MSNWTIDDPSEYFQTHGYTGNGGTQDITLGGNSNLQADMIWIKQITSESNYIIQDTNKGINKSMFTDNNAQEQTDSTFGHVNSVSSNGFQVDEGNSGEANANKNGQGYSAWVWKVNGGTTSSNSDGNGNNSTVQVNQTAGISIAQHSASSNGVANTYGHGLGVTPGWQITRARNRTENWWMWYQDRITSGTVGAYTMDTNAAFNTSSTLHGAPTSSVYSVGTDYGVNGTWNYINYIWAPIQGFSHFGQFYGNSSSGAANGTFVYCGFKPAWIWIKRRDNADHHFVWDNIQNPYNVSDWTFRLNESVNGGADTAYKLDIYANGFKLKNTFSGLNNNGEAYSFAAFAERPFTTSSGQPTTAR